jgi:hypothetical protein
MNQDKVISKNLIWRLYSIIVIYFWQTNNYKPNFFQQKEAVENHIPNDRIPLV